MTLFDLLFSLDSSFGEKLQRGIENACKLAEGIRNAIKRCPIDGFVEVSCSLTLVEHNFPPCLRVSREQQISIIDMLSNNDTESVSELLLSVYSEEIITDIFQFNYIFHNYLFQIVVLPQGIEKPLSVIGIPISSVKTSPSNCGTTQDFTI